MSVSNWTSQVCYLLIDPMIIGALGAKWPLAKYRNCCRDLEENIIAPLFQIMLKLEQKSPRSQFAVLLLIATEKWVLGFKREMLE